MCSTSSRLLVTAAFSLVMCWRYVDATASGTCDNADQFMLPDARRIMKTLHRRYAAAMASSGAAAALSAGNDVSPCLGGDLFVDLPMARYLQSRIPSRRKRAFFVNFTAQPDHKWSSTIPYYFNFTGESTDTLVKALQYVEGQTCLRFTETTTDFTQPYLSFLIGSSCTTFSGRSTDTNATPFILTVNCLSAFGELIKLLANVLGMLDENLRPDRGPFIYINNSNIDSSNRPNLQPVPGYVMASVYDYASVTHAHSKQYAAGPWYTILPTDPLYLKVIGQQVEWSFLDTKAVNSFYCDGVCRSAIACQQGGYVDPKNCARCRCPDGFAGTTCQSMAPHSDANCGAQQELTATSSDQYITSPGYSTQFSYRLYTNCTWKISAPSGSSYKIQLKFVDSFGMYEDMTTSTCCHWVEIRYDGSLNNTGPRFCGRQVPPMSLVTDAREVLVLFRSNWDADSVENVGFKLLYRLVTCDPEWSSTVRENTNSLGAQRVSQLLTEDGCRDLCAYDLPGCVAVDVNRNQLPYPTCWVHLSASNLDSVYSSAGVRQHRINMTSPECLWPTSATTTTPSGECVPWRSFAGVNSAFGTRDPSITTLDDCLEACVANQQCVAVDWDASGGSSAGCWVHTDARNLENQYSSPGVTQYQLTRCASVSSTTSTSTTTPTTTSTTQPSSSLSTSEGDARSLPPTPPSTPTTCVPTWTTHAGQNSINGDLQTDVSTLAACRAACIADQRCAALDWKQAGPDYCWLHRQLNGPYHSPGVTQHILVERCQTTSETTTTTTTTTTLRTTPSTSSQCRETWMERQGVHSMHAEPRSSLTTLDACQRACIADEQCVAVDWNSSPSPGQASCWLHLDADNLRSRYSSSSVTQYELTNRCSTFAPSTTTATAECRPTWIIRNNTQSVGATLIVEPIQADDCLNRCAVSATCVAVDLVTSCTPPQCWMHHHRRNLLRRYRGVNVTQYELNTRCATIAPPSSDCGGVGAFPGQLCQPCIVPLRPPQICSKQRWEQRWVYTHGRYVFIPQLVTVQVACTRYSCTDGAVLAVLQGVQSCVWVGWTGWSSCSVPCHGTQQRSYWHLAGHHYSISRSESRWCNTWC